MEAKGKPGPDELKLLEPFREKLPASVFGDPYTPPESDGSGFDRALLKQAYDLLIAAGCQRDGDAMKLPGGKPLTIEFLDFSSALQPHTTAVHPESRQARHPGQYPRGRRDAVQGAHRRLRLRRGHGGERRLEHARRGAQSRLHLRGRRAAGFAQPLRRLRSGRRRAGRRRSSNAKSREELNTACRALDRVLRAGHYWVPMWYRDTAWVAYWDAFSRPERQPSLGTGAPGTWWWDADKAKAIGL